MSVPAGWYDDGSGRQRWWDGERWTDQFAPDAGAAPVPDAPAAAPAAGADAAAAYPVTVAPGAVAPAVRRPAVWGFVGLGLAVVGTVLGCIPVVPVIVPGMLLLFAALVVSIVALFVKNTAKWPAIVGLVLSVIGGVIAVIVLIVTLAFAAVQALPTGGPSDAPTPSGEPSESAAPPDSERPSPDEIGVAWEQSTGEGNPSVQKFLEARPEVRECAGQYMYDSDLTDEELRLFIAGDPNAPTNDQYDRITQTAGAAADACEPNE